MTVPENEEADEKNPDFIYSLTHTSLLCKIVSGEINAVELARQELWARGLNEKGVYIRHSTGI